MAENCDTTNDPAPMCRRTVEHIIKLLEGGFGPGSAPATTVAHYLRETLAAGDTRARTIVHVNQHIIRANAMRGTSEPALTIKHRGETVNAHEAEIVGPSRVVYRPDRPLSCGARVWIETHSGVILRTNC